MSSDLTILYSANKRFFYVMGGTLFPRHWLAVIPNEDGNREILPFVFWDLKAEKDDHGKSVLRPIAEDDPLAVAYLATMDERDKHAIPPKRCPRCNGKGWLDALDAKGGE